MIMLGMQARAADHVGEIQPRRGQTEPWLSVLDLVHQIEGRFLASLIRPGMPMRDVSALLGASDSPLPTVCVISGACWRTEAFGRFGIEIDSQFDEHGVRRVTRVGLRCVHPMDD
jgi:hypothetical protein